MTKPTTLRTDIIGGFPFADPNCRGCGKELTIENAWITDGCPCNTSLGVNSMNETRWRLLMQLQQSESRQLERLWPQVAKLDEYREVAVRATRLLDLMDDVSDDIGDQTDRVFALYEFDELRKALDALKEPKR